MRKLRTSIILLIDVIATASLAAAFAIAAGLSGTFQLGPWHVSATSVRNPLTIAALALLIRSTDPAVPFLHIVPLSTLSRGALPTWHRVHDALHSLTLERAVLLVYGMMAASLALKLAMAWRHPGFWTGDDVEIHEMTFARLFHFPWRAWELRSPFYPMAVIYPIQALLVRAGQTDPACLVFAGRAVVATCTIVTVWLTFQVARRIFDSVPIALVAAVLLATNKLHVMTGTTELPRPVASLLVLAAFWSIVFSSRAIAMVSGGMLIGAASAMRFSEEVFVVPALLAFAAGRRWRDALLFAMGFAGVVVMSFGLLDAIYWGEPFFSVRHSVDFTVTRGLSSRGYQPWFEYIRTVPAWTNVGVFALAVYATVWLRLWTLAAWTWIPLLSLSVLPHKEPRYLVPILPFFAMLAAAGVWRATLRLHEPAVSVERRQRIALVAGAAALVMMVTEPMSYLLPRTDDGVAVGRYIASVDPTGGVVAGQVWNIGGRIYLPRSNPLIDLSPVDASDPLKVSMLLQTQGVTWLVLQERHLVRLGNAAVITEAGFDEVPVPMAHNSSYRVYRRH